MKLDDCRYDKIKLLYKLSAILHFIEKHATHDAKDVKDNKFHQLLQEMKKHLEQVIGQLDTMVCE